LLLIARSSFAQILIFDAICLIVGQVKQAASLVDQIDHAFHDPAVPWHQERHFAAEDARAGKAGVRFRAKESSEDISQLGLDLSAG